MVQYKNIKGSGLNKIINQLEFTVGCCEKKNINVMTQPVKPWAPNNMRSRIHVGRFFLKSLMENATVTRKSIMLQHNGEIGNP
ncbi:MAG: hypothetical protein PHU66_09910, partial [Bacteroidaceae bacterium]|nr:hypothetical protein [Bacteroidaceae bacterium]